MHYNLYDRFRGSWWGGLIGQNWVNQLLIVPQTRDLFSQPWLRERRHFTTMLLESELTVDHLGSFWDLQSTVSQQDPILGLKHNSSLLSLLPLIIFTPDNRNLDLKIIPEGNLKSVNLAKNSSLQQDILIWSYLITKVLNHQTNIFEQHQVIEEIVNLDQEPENPLINQLILVSQGIQQGKSLHQVGEQIIAKNQLRATAISLAWYCFATTPDNFRLSTQRAGQIEPNLAWLTTALTGTLSGAYNGMTRISRNWQVAKEQKQDEQLENHLLVKIFRSWLGIHGGGMDQITHNWKLDAIAPPGLIQPRRSLKIISQLSSDN